MLEVEDKMNQRLWVFCSLFIIVLVTSAQSTPPAQQPRPSVQDKHSGEDVAVQLERQAWEAVKAKQYTKYVRLLAKDFVDIEPVGIITRKEEEKGIVQLTINEYKWERLRIVHLSPNVTLLVYKAIQKANFGGQPVPTPTWVSSLWIKRNGTWLNVFVQETKAD
jgi:hypothetical protein